MSASGRFVALRRDDHLDVVDVQGTAPRRRFELAATGSFAIAGATLGLHDGVLVRTIPLEGEGPEGSFAVSGDYLEAFCGRAASAFLVGPPATTIAFDAARGRLEKIGEARGDTRWFPLHGRAVLAVERDRLAIMASGRVQPIETSGDGSVIAAAPLFAGRALLVVTKETAAVMQIASNTLLHRVRIDDARWHAIAAERGLLLLGTGDDVVTTIDLRLGRIMGQGRAPHAVTTLAVDEDGRTLAIAGPGGEMSVMRLDALGPLAEPDGAAVPEVTIVEPPAPWLAPAPEPEVPAASIAPELPEALPIALGQPPRTLTSREITDAEPFADADAHLEALLDLVAARAAVAIAEAWDSGRLSADTEGQHPFEREVGALAGLGGGHAGGQVATACELLALRASSLSRRVHASLRAGVTLPFVELADELKLSAMAMQILITVVAPSLRCMIGRMYRILGNGTSSASCDVSQLTLLLARPGSAMSDHILDELSPGAPLVRYGVVHVDSHGHLEVDQVLVARLRGHCALRTIRRADRDPADLVLDRAALAAFMRELAEARPAESPLRAVVRGRRGSGRHTVIAALAARVGCAIALVDVTELPLSQLARELTRASLSRAVPVVSNAETFESGDREAARQLRQILRDHPGPLVVRMNLDGAPPLDPGFAELVLPALSETIRAGVFTAALEAAAISADAAQLARRYKVAPGTIHRVVASARARIKRAEAAPADHDAIVDEAARQHLATRINATAQRVSRLASWDQVSLPEEMVDSIRELIGRARHGRTVYDTWGYEDRITTARGITALFYGPPGTGKTMVAGLIARELGLELYRVDLAKVMSKWIGETEKHLGELFDAAEDGRIMLLFDEADSLFAKRTEVKSSNDRYANLEVNYLLQRLDAFEGVALLTTNLDGSIDPAFKRRLSMRMYFPLPDEEARAQLWSAHVTSQIPTAGVLDFGALARRFPLSGGYIRNSALRAAFLAAQEGTPLTQQHLERAVLLEYRELGKLADDGRVD
jgi:hypothetical protein